MFFTRKFLLIFAAALLVCSCANMHWKQAQTTNTIAAYEEFLANYPDNTHAADARARIETLLFEKASCANTIEAYEEFLNSYPTGGLSNKAQSAIEDLVYGAAASSNAATDFQDYLKRYPDGRFASLAQQKISELSIEKAQSTEIIEPPQEGIPDHPETIDRKLPSPSAENVRYAAIKTSENINDLKKYLKDFPHSRHSKNVREKVARLETIYYATLVKDIDINALGRWGDTPLHEAALNGNFEVAKALLMKGANAEAQIERTGITPLHAAARGDHADIVQLLLDSGANVNARDKLGNTPLNFTEDEKISKLLIRHGGVKNRECWNSVQSPPKGLLEQCPRITYDQYDKEWRCQEEEEDPFVR